MGAGLGLLDRSGGTVHATADIDPSGYPVVRGASGCFGIAVRCGRVRR